MSRNCLHFAFPFALLLTQAAHAARPIELASGTPPNHPQQPQVAVDGAGGIHVVFGIGDQIRYCRSADGGKSFSNPVNLPLVSNMSLGMRRGPRVAAAEHFVCVTAIGGKQGKGRDGDILAFRSTDGGKSWQVPTTVNDEPAAAREGLHAMAAGPNGELCCVWLDLRNKGTKIFASTSSDGGATWTKNLLVYESPDGHVCECCHPSVTFDAQGGLYVMWRNALAGNRDLYACTSTDAGKTFSPASKLGEGTWPLKACPMDGGAVAALAPWKFATAWRRDKQIFLTLPGEPKERLLGSGEQPWIAATADGPFVVWVKKRGEQLCFLRPGDREAVEIARHAADPVVASSSTGTGPLVAVWESRDAGRYAIQCQILAP
jgi:BNR repeat-like domain